MESLFCELQIYNIETDQWSCKIKIKDSEKKDFGRFFKLPDSIFMLKLRNCSTVYFDLKSERYLSEPILPPIPRANTIALIIEGKGENHHTFQGNISRTISRV